MSRLSGSLSLRTPRRMMRPADRPGDVGAGRAEPGIGSEDVQEPMEPGQEVGPLQQHELTVALGLLVMGATPISPVGRGQVHQRFLVERFRIRTPNSSRAGAVPPAKMKMHLPMGCVTCPSWNAPSCIGRQQVLQPL